MAVSAVVCVGAGFYDDADVLAAERAQATSHATARPAVRAVITHAALAVKPCESADVEGTWNLVSYNVAPEARDAARPYLFPYQVFQFAPDGLLRSVHSKQALPSDPSPLLDRTQDALRYEIPVSQQGAVVVRASDRTDAVETWQCRRVLNTPDRKDAMTDVGPRAVQSGDLILTLVSKRGTPLFTRQLRRP
ncbi:MAG: hypothetical protein U0172_11280 [Nitrospiraceae bacterium]